MEIWGREVEKWVCDFCKGLDGGRAGRRRVIFSIEARGGGKVGKYRGVTLLPMFYKVL